MWAMHLPLRNTQRRSSQCAEAGTPSVAQVSRIWFLALEPRFLCYTGDGKKGGCLLPVNEQKITNYAIDRVYEFFSNTSTIV